MTGFSSMNDLSPQKNDGFLLGTVKFNNDPERLQRIKVSVPRLMEGDVNNLPWISPILSAPQGFTSSAGVMEVPALGALVVVQFQSGQIYYGLCHGSVPTKSHTPNAALLLNYPNRRGWSDTAGNLMWVDVTSGQTEFHLSHVSGTYVHIDNLGNLHISSVKQVLVDCETAVVNASVSTAVTCPTNTINGNLVLNGNLTHTGNTVQTGNVTINGKNVGSTHVHSGVQAGGSNSGQPV